MKEIGVQLEDKNKFKGHFNCRFYKVITNIHSIKRNIYKFEIFYEVPKKIIILNYGNIHIYKYEFITFLSKIYLYNF